MLKLGYYCVHSHQKRSSYSGVPFYTHRALSRHASVDLHVLSPPYSKMARLFHRGQFARCRVKLDAVVSLVSSDQVGKLNQNFGVPVIHVTDATPKYIRDHYDPELSPETDRVERQAVRTASAVVYSSDYFCRVAEAEFGQEISDKLHALSFGANIDDQPQTCALKTLEPPLRLLWIGGDWKRKGGEIAVNCAKLLRKLGVQTHLTLVGNVPPEYRDQTDTVCYKYLNKDKSKDLEIYKDEFRRAHFLVCPTRADITPMVIAEANAFSVPVLISNVGAVHSLLSDGLNGQFVEANPDAYAKVILKFVGKPADYEALVQSTFSIYRQQFDWNVWADGIVKIAEDLRGCRAGR